eukprot:TRINITY_DN76017_c0_g1_i1.p1 TRINITY_DN76017_c0_g1~~TRINITY_DN76017_c0_g1_i1.p1  ORF type:complete len:456 (+),score=53.29 TRINITY_DN76017_c0_g1_i1:98-1369(+)
MWLPLALAAVAGAGALDAGMHPIILVPGITSSVLEAHLENKPHYRDCWRNSSQWYTIWASAEQLSSRFHCWVDNMRIDTADDSGCTQLPVGVEIRAKGWGGTNGCDIVNPGSPYPIHVFKEFFETLEGIGYVSNDTLKTATYDWRRLGDPCFTRHFFESLQAMIQETSSNHGMSVKLTCHSMGCQILHLFLAKSVSPEWKAAHVHSVLAMGPTFAGTTKVVNQWITGPNYPILPMSIENFGRRASGTWPAMVALMPRNLEGVPNMWHDSTVFVQTPQRNYTFADLHFLIDEVGQQVESNRFGSTYVKAIDELYKGAGHPGVPFTCVYITDVNTTLLASYADNIWSEDTPPKELTFMQGDRANPTFSAEVPCKAWGGRLVPLALGGVVNHVSMLQNKEILGLVENFATGNDIGGERTKHEAFIV